MSHHTTTPLVVAVDGPSGSGKSSVSQEVARRLNLAYLDTGAMYRAATLWCLTTGTNLDVASQVTQAISQLPISIPTDPDDQRWFFRITGPNEELHLAEITDEIREPEVSKTVSKVATNLEARALLVRWQQQIVRDHLTTTELDTHGIIVEGRDITTVITPDAPVRILLTASPETRLRRRAIDNTGNSGSDALAATTDEVIRRDRDDSTVADFMEASKGVTTVDSTSLNFEETVTAVLTVIDQKTGQTTSRPSERTNND